MADDKEQNAGASTKETMDDSKDHNALSDNPPVSAFANMSRGQCIRKFWRLYGAGLIVSLGGMYVGYSGAVIGNIVANEGFINQFATVTDPDTGEPALKSSHLSLWTAINFVSQIIMQLVSPITADRFGRKFNLWALMLLLVLAIILHIVSKEWIGILMSRFVSGLAGGLIGTSVMVYMSEIAMPQFRGALLGSFSLSYALGQLFSAVGLQVLEETARLKFRNIFYSEFVFCGLWAVPLILLPESPAWYAARGRHEDAKKSLRKLVGNVAGYDVDHEYKVLRFEVEQSVALAKTETENIWRVMFKKINLKRIVISQLPFTFQNFVGVPLFFNYTTYFFSLANVDDPFLANLIIQLVLLFGITISFYLVDKIGRRTLVVYGGGLLAIICFVMGGLGFLPESTSAGPALVAVSALWTFIYALSMAPIGWISLVEISSPHLRAKTTAMAAIIQSCTGILFNYTVPLMLSNQEAGWGQKTGLFFGGIATLYLIPCILFYPETKGRTYQELDELFERRIPAWKFAATVTAYQAEVENQQGRVEAQA
ncbi:general substrate transporter [Aspergillus carlsbadensis]|nr:general substrate transporter [Aspergillus carlsbadensis]